MTVPMAMLALLDPAPAHGFALKQHYDRLLGIGRELRVGQVYSTLARLERDGLAVTHGVEPGSGPERKLFAISEAGVTELETWLGSAELPEGRPDVLFSKVVLALASGRDADDVLEIQRSSHLGRMRAITAARTTGTVVDRLIGDFELAHLEADLNWIEIAGARMKDLRLSVAEVMGR
jgi:DNA-binding PadR family transcriptional regulator